MPTIDEDIEELTRAARIAKFECLSQEEYRRRYCEASLPRREWEIEIER